MKMPLKNKWVLITGASSGFGAAAARAFGVEGAKLLLGARRVDRLEKVAAEAREAGAAEAYFHELDVTKTPSVETFVAWAKSKIQDPGCQTPDPTRLHILINNAGGAHGQDTVAEGKDGDWDFMLQTNVLGLLRVTRALLLVRFRLRRLDTVLFCLPAHDLPRRKMVGSDDCFISF